MNSLKYEDIIPNAKSIWEVCEAQTWLETTLVFSQRGARIPFPPHQHKMQVYPHDWEIRIEHEPYVKHIYNNRLARQPELVFAASLRCKECGVWSDTYLSGDIHSDRAQLEGEW